MPTIRLEGIGAVLEAGVSTFDAEIKTLSLPERAREVIDFTHLGSVDFTENGAGKLKDPGQVSVTVGMDHTVRDLINSDPETWTVKWPLRSGQTTADQITFTGYVVSAGGEEFAANTAQDQSITIQVQGDFTFTAGA